MAMVVTQERHDTYTVQLDEPEKHWLRDAAKAMGMTKSTVIAAALAKGLTHYLQMLREIVEHEKRKAEQERDSDNGKKTED